MKNSKAVRKMPMQTQTASGHGKYEPRLDHDIRAEIGQQLRISYDDVVDQLIPERFAELVNRLDERESRDD